MNKFRIPLTSLFTDQILEEEIVGVSQNEDALDRLLHTIPHLTSVVKECLTSCPRPWNSAL